MALTDDVDTIFDIAGMYGLALQRWLRAMAFGSWKRERARAEQQPLPYVCGSLRLFFFGAAAAGGVVFLLGAAAPWRHCFFSIPHEREGVDLFL
jgi:hypothetical protein